MTLETITREEFDKRLDAANARRSEELQTLETKQAMVEQTLAHYERTLREIEITLNSNVESAPLPPLRKRLQELAERTALLAASV